MGTAVCPVAMLMETFLSLLVGRKKTLHMSYPHLGIRDLLSELGTSVGMHEP